MKKIRWTVALLLLAIWVPAAAQCSLEKSGLLQADCCPVEGFPSSHGAVFCCTVGSANYKIEEQPTVPPWPVIALLHQWVELSDWFWVDSPVFPPAPPELDASWQFQVRAAPAVRAPTFLS